MIPIKNIYYMLSYAFHVLNEKEYETVATEEFDNILELFSEILAIGLNKQVKQGLMRDYIPKNETTSRIKGKLNISNSIKSQNIQKRQLNCSYDDFSVNCYLNQIIKTTLVILLKNNLSKKRRNKLKKIIIYFLDVDILDVKDINWKIHYDRNNQSYQMIIGICYFVINNLLQSNVNGNFKLKKFLDNQAMSRLYEKFILNYYKKEFPMIKSSSPQIKWQLDNDEKSMLPIMQTDITLSKGDKILIIDAKYYGKMTQQNYGVNSIHSGNLYQIFAYVKNKEAELGDVPHEVAGMLLYAKTDEEIILDNNYMMSGNLISVKTLDLNVDFNLIKEQLNSIANTFFTS